MSIEIDVHCWILLTVISIFIMSPSANGLSSGMPWHATLFTDVQTDFGNIEYRRGDGYAFDAIVSLWTNSSISSVVNPGYRWATNKKTKIIIILINTQELKEKKHVWFYLEHSGTLFKNIGCQSTSLSHCHYGACHFNFRLWRFKHIWFISHMKIFGFFYVFRNKTFGRYSTRPYDFILSRVGTVNWNYIKCTNENSIKTDWLSTCILSIFFKSKKLPTIRLISFGKC